MTPSHPSVPPRSWLLALAVALASACPMRQDADTGQDTVHDNDSSDIVLHGEWREIAVGAGTICAIDADGRIRCWGQPAAGPPVPDPPEAPGHFSLQNFTVGGCALNSAGSVECWTAIDAPGKVPVADVPLTQLAVSGSRGCGLDAAGYAHCSADTVTPESAFERIFAGEFDMCGVQLDGTLGLFSNSSTNYEVPPPAGMPVRDVVCSDGMGHAIMDDGAIATWWNVDHSVMPPPTDGDFVRVFTRTLTPAFHSCAQEVDGELVCWGFDAPQSPPPSGVTFVDVSLASSAACGVTDLGSIHCWKCLDVSSGCIELAAEAAAEQ